MRKGATELVAKPAGAGSKSCKTVKQLWEEKAVKLLNSSGKKKRNIGSYALDHVLMIQ